MVIILFPIESYLENVISDLGLKYEPTMDFNQEKILNRVKSDISKALKNHSKKIIPKYIYIYHPNNFHCGDGKLRIAQSELELKYSDAIEELFSMEKIIFYKKMKNNNTDIQFKFKY